MIFISPAEIGVLGLFEAFNDDGDRIMGKLTLNQQGSGELRFVPEQGYEGERYEEFLAADRRAEAAKGN